MWNTANTEIITLSDHTKEIKAKIQSSKHLFQFLKTSQRKNNTIKHKKKINEMENKHALRRIDEVKNWFFENKPQIRQTAKSRKLGVNVLWLNDL